jgi:DNA repair exonuclease SbcCD nuclease subunit
LPSFVIPGNHDSREPFASGLHRRWLFE